MLTIAACSMASVIVLFVGRDALPAWTFPILLAAATLLVEWAIFASHEDTSPYTAFYFWIAIYAFWGAAALHPSMRALEDRGPDREPRLRLTRLGLLTCATLIAPALELDNVVRHNSLDLVTTITLMIKRRWAFYVPLLGCVGQVGVLAATLAIGAGSS